MGRPVTVWHPFRVAELRSLAAQRLSFAQAAKVLHLSRAAVQGAARRHKIVWKSA
jgi:predicted transcriptional regulator